MVHCCGEVHGQLVFTEKPILLHQHIVDERRTAAVVRARKTAVFLSMAAA